MKALLHRTRLAAGIVTAGLFIGNSAVLAAWSDVPPEHRGKISSAVAVVGAVWEDDDLLVQFHRSLAERYKDTPELGQFRREEQWVSTYTSRSLRYPGVFNGRSSKGLNLRVGDIVRIRLEDYRKIDSYYRLSSVEEVLCRSSDPVFEACSERTPLAWTMKSER